MTLWLLPIEPLPERYSIQWIEWFREALTARGVHHMFIPGATLTSSVETGTVLDAVGTNYWKATQLRNVCELFHSGDIKDGDKIFAFDVWFPGLEMIPYMATLKGIRVDLYGFLHAGSYTTEDFAEPLSAWAQHSERAWIRACRKVFVGTAYHADAFARRRLQAWPEYKRRLVVTGNPFSCLGIHDLCSSTKPVAQREKIVVYPHRFDREKRPNVFMDIMEALWTERQDFRVVFTTSRPSFRSNDPALLERLKACKFAYEIRANLTKCEYYQTLADSRVFVSTTIEENFGYCLAEAMLLGCTPVVPYAYSHPELL